MLVFQLPPPWEQSGMFVSAGDRYQPLSEAVRRAVLKIALKSDYTHVLIDVLVGSTCVFLCVHVCVCARESQIPWQFRCTVLLLCDVGP